MVSNHAVLEDLSEFRSQLCHSGGAHHSLLRLNLVRPLADIASTGWSSSVPSARWSGSVVGWRRWRSVYWPIVNALLATSCTMQVIETCGATAGSTI